MKITLMDGSFASKTKAIPSPCVCMMLDAFRAGEAASFAKEWRETEPNVDPSFRDYEEIQDGDSGAKASAGPW